MVNMLSMFHAPDTYTGCRTFAALSQYTGISLDLVNFLICQVIAFLLASTFRTTLHPLKVSTNRRHQVALFGGLLIGLFCYGPQAIHILIMPTICFIMMKTVRPQVVQIWVMAMAMSYLLVIHVLRQIYTNGTDLLDVTGPLMVITQKVTNLAFNIHDGRGRNLKELTKRQEMYAVKELPTILEYYSYVLDFHVILSGPVIFYKDYIEFIDGSNFRKYDPPVLAPQPTSQQIQQEPKNVDEDPSPSKAIFRKCVGSVICGYIYMKYAKQYPIRRIKCPIFLKQTNVLQKLWYLIMATTCFRFKFYHAWLMSDAICNNSGLGFAGYDVAGVPKWNLVSNINVIGFELSTNMREAISCWNLGTNQWLRYIVYDRTPPKYSTALTFALSAVWHGFYPGYYLTFATGALMVTAGRKARRMFRHHFQQSIFTRLLYDFLTFLTTRYIMAYSTFPFILLEFTGSFNMYLRLYLCLHIVAIVVVFVLPNFLQMANFVESSVVANSMTPGKRKISNNDSSRSSQYMQHNNEHQNSRQRHLKKYQGLNNDISSYCRPYSSSSMSKRHDIDGTIQTIGSEKISNNMSDKNIMDSSIIKGVKLTTEDNNAVQLSRNLVEDLRLPSLVIDQRSTVGQPKTLDGNGSALFLKKEIEAIKAAVQQDNMLPAMLSNGHAAK